MHDALSLGENKHAIYVCIPRSKSVCTTHFGVSTAKTSTLYMYVYLALKAYARRT